MCEKLKEIQEKLSYLPNFVQDEKKIVYKAREQVELNIVK